MKTASLAIVFTDIAGFTERTALQSHAENERLLKAHAALLEPAFKAFGGRIVKRIGDAYLVVFRSPTKAVLCGAALQDRLWDYNRRASQEQRLQVRVAINAGEVRLERGDVFGAAVNTASRVEAMAAPGEVLFTEAVWLMMDRAEVASVPRGVQQLRGVPEPVKLYSLPVNTGDCPPYGRLGLSRVRALPAVDPRRSERPSVLRWRAGAAAALVALSMIVFWGGALRARQPAPPLPLQAVAKAATVAPPASPLLRKLAQQLRDPRCDVRARAAAELGRLGEPAAAPALRKLLASRELPDEAERRSIFDCSSREAARAALAKLAPRQLYAGTRD